MCAVCERGTISTFLTKISFLIFFHHNVTLALLPHPPFTASLLSGLCCLPLYTFVAIFPIPNIGLMYKGLSNSNVSVQTKTPLTKAAKVSHPSFQKTYIQQSLNSEINYYLSNTLGFDQSSLTSGGTLPDVSISLFPGIFSKFLNSHAHQIFISKYR